MIDLSILPAVQAAILAVLANGPRDPLSLEIAVVAHGIKGGPFNVAMNCWIATANLIYLGQVRQLPGPAYELVPPPDPATVQEGMP